MVDFTAIILHTLGSSVCKISHILLYSWFISDTLVTCRCFLLFTLIIPVYFVAVTEISCTDCKSCAAAPK